VFLLITNIKKTDPEVKFYFKWIYFAILLALVILSILLAFVQKFGYSIYGGTFNSGLPLIFWIYFKIILDSSPFPVLTTLLLFGVLKNIRSVKNRDKIYIFEGITIFLTLYLYLFGPLDAPTSLVSIQAYLSLILDIFKDILFYLQFIGIALVINKLFGTILEDKLFEFLQIQNQNLTEDQQLDLYVISKVVFSIIGSFGFYIVITILFSSLNVGLAIIIGGIYALIPVVILLLLIIVILLGYFELRKIKLVNKMNILIASTIILAMMITPITMIGDTTRTISKAEDALYDVKIATNPVQEYPVLLEEIRLVDRDLAIDIADNLKLPEPPKSFRVSVLDEYEEIGFINGTPSWIVPIRYSQVFGNPETNLIAGYIAVNLNNPIPEDSVVRYSEMQIGPGLDGFRNYEWVVREHFPEYLVGNVFLVDPWKGTNEPAWVVILDKYTSWGIRESNLILSIHADGTLETLTREEALEEGLSQINSDYSILSLIEQATAYMRGNKIDPSSRGYLFLPSSPDVQDSIGYGDIDTRIGNEYYYNAHHFLMANDIIGRDRYMTVKTGSKESIVVWTVINQSLTYYDLRTYTKGGISGVNSPDAVFGDINQITSESRISNLAVRYPKLYKVENIAGNNTLLIWVSIVVEKRSGADRFAGMSFVDASNPRFSKFLSAQLGEKAQTFKSRFKDAINQTYAGFVGENDTIGGETSVITLSNVTVLRNDWVFLQPSNTYARILYIQSGSEKIFFIVTENSVASKKDFYTALLVKEGDLINIEARWDLTNQGWLATRISLQN
jgi:hypothetical protein